MGVKGSETTTGQLRNRGVGCGTQISDRIESQPHLIIAVPYGLEPVTQRLPGINRVVGGL